MDVERRVGELITSPAGCVFLLTLEESGLDPATLADPAVAMFAAGIALSTVTIWRTDHDLVVSEALRHGPRLADLARQLLAQPAAASWFAPVDRAAQWYLIEPKSITLRGQPLEPESPPTRWERYAQKPEHAIYTSTAWGNSCAALAAREEGAGDYDPQFPLGRTQLTVVESARVYEVDGSRAWHDLSARYPALDDDGRTVPDWGLVARDWDAVHLTVGGLLASEQVRVESTAGWSEHRLWDHEQTAWFRWMFEETRRLPDLKELPSSPVELGTPGVLFGLGVPTVWHRIDPERTHQDDGSPVYDHFDPPPPPKRPPSATLRTIASTGSPAGESWVLTGLRIWQRWIVADQLETFEPNWPYPWPEPTPIASRKIEIAWESSAPPESVQVTVFRSMGADGHPGPAAVKHWFQHQPFGNDCTLALSPTGQAWTVHITLPPEPGPCFVVTHATWSLPRDSPVHVNPGWPCFDATCIFAVECT